MKNTFASSIIIVILISCIIPANAATEFEATLIKPVTYGLSISGIASAIGPDHRPHILFTQWGSDNSDEPGNRIIYGAQSDGGWDFETVTIGSWQSGNYGLAIDAVGRPHIALNDPDVRDVVYATRDQNGWVFESLGVNDSWSKPAIEIDPLQKPAIAHFRYDPSAIFGTLVLTSKIEVGVWQDTPSLVPQVLRNFKNQHDLVFDDFGNPHVAYTGFSDWTGPGFVSIASPDPFFGDALTEKRIHTMQWDFARFGQSPVIAIPTGGVSLAAISTTPTHGELVQYTLVDQEVAGGVVNRPIFPVSAWAGLSTGPDGKTWLLYAYHSLRGGPDRFKLNIIDADSTILDTFNLSELGTGEYASMISDSRNHLHMIYVGNDGISYIYIPEPASFGLFVPPVILLIRRFQRSLRG